MNVKQDLDQPHSDQSSDHPQPPQRRPRGFAAAAAAASVAAGGAGGPSAGKGRKEREKEKERTKLRERHRRAITSRMLAGLRQYGNFPLPARADMNDVLAALAREAGWAVDPDGTTYRTSPVALVPTPPPPPPPGQLVIVFLFSVSFDVGCRLRFWYDCLGFFPFSELNLNFDEVIRLLFLRELLLSSFFSPCCALLSDQYGTVYLVFVVW